MQEFGKRYVEIYQKALDCGCSPMTPSEASGLLSQLGLTILPPQNPTIAYWYDLLKTNDAPIIVLVKNKGPNTIYHAIVVIGMKGKGNPNDTEVTYIDPVPGSMVTQHFQEFLQWYEGGANWKGKGQILFFKK